MVVTQGSREPPLSGRQLLVRSWPGREPDSYDHSYTPSLGWRFRVRKNSPDVRPAPVRLHLRFPGVAGPAAPRRRRKLATSSGVSFRFLSRIGGPGSRTGSGTSTSCLLVIRHHRRDRRHDASAARTTATVPGLCPRSRARRSAQGVPLGVRSAPRPAHRSGAA